MSAAPKRNLVVCCDGTSNEIGSQLSNVLKLYRIVDKDADQLTYYHPGIGTVAMPETWGRRWQQVHSVFEMMTGHGLDRDVLNAYCFLCRHYQPGDNIYLFGFSRGAYTVRVVAGLIYLIGLLREHQVNFAGYALRAYKAASANNSYEVAWQFNRVVNGLRVPIRFLGVWDTVASVVVPGRGMLSGFGLEELPYTSENPAVEVFRHAMAIDEFRRMFRLKPWIEPQTFKPNPFSQKQTFPVQDCRLVWFAGCHSDVGGGFIEEESALSKFPLRWMIEEAVLHGLRVRRSMVNHLVRGLPRKNARLYTMPNAAGPLHVSLTNGWKPLEWWPQSVRRREWPGRRGVLGLYLPRGEPRVIEENAFVHQSVFDRMARVPTYRPTNLPTRYRIEPANVPP